MTINIRVCDCCMKPLESKKKLVLGQEIIVYKRYPIHVFGEKDEYPLDLCQECALKIDNAVLKFKLECLSLTDQNKRRKTT